MKATLIRNDFGNIGFFYGQGLGFVPTWAALDVERGELSVYNDDDEMKLVHIEGMSDKIYTELLEQEQILLVEVTDNNINQPKNAQWVHLMVSHQV